MYACMYVYVDIYIYIYISGMCRRGGGALGALAPALFQNYSKVPLLDKLQ